MSSYVAGNPVACYTSQPFTNEAGAAVDPTTVTFKWAWAAAPGQPPGVATSWTFSGATQPAVGVVAKTATGAYEAWIDTTGMADGIVVYEFSGTGAAQAVQSGTFWVKAAAL